MGEGFTFIIELKTLQNHADRAVALLDRGYKWNYKYLTCTLQGHFSAFDGRVNAVKILGLGGGTQRFNLKASFTRQCCLLISRQLHGSPMLTKSIITVSKTPGTE